MFFLVLLICGIVLLVNQIRKRQKLKRDLSIVIIITLIFFGLIALDIYLIANRSLKAADDAASATGKHLVMTYDAIKSTWDERSVEKLKNVHITILKSSATLKDNIKKYKIEILFNNKNTRSESMPISEMVEFNYLSLSDKDDVFYKVDSFKSESSLLPTGKSKATLYANVEKNVNLGYVKLADVKTVIKK